jgi:ubiquinone/menaquinone biosynthesis C-methylase UbiE
MCLADEYQRQFQWRDWVSVLNKIPLTPGQLVLDLGCGPGDQAAELTKLGARVVGIDSNEDLLSVARQRGIPGAEFRLHDLAALPDLELTADGIWCSFACAYFPDLVATLTAWKRHLRDGGWIALTEVDDLFGHEPLSDGAKAHFDALARDALAAKRYDFHMGGKLAQHLKDAGFVVLTEFALTDQELAFEGAASDEVLEAWNARFDRLRTLRARLGDGFERLRDEFTRCLESAVHRSRAQVRCCVARS